MVMLDSPLRESDVAFSLFRGMPPSLWLSAWRPSCSDIDPATELAEASPLVDSSVMKLCCQGIWKRSRIASGVIPVATGGHLTQQNTSLENCRRVGLPLVVTTRTLDFQISDRPNR